MDERKTLMKEATRDFNVYLSDGIFKFPDSHGRPPFTTPFIVRCIFSSVSEQGNTQKPFKKHEET